MKEHVVSFRVDKDVFAYLQRWAANSGKTVTDILLELIENSRNTRVVNASLGYVELNGRKIAYPQSVSPEHFQQVVTE